MPVSDMVQATGVTQIGIFDRIPIINVLLHLVFTAGDVKLTIPIKQQESIHGVGTFDPTHVGVVQHIFRLSRGSQLIGTLDLDLSVAELLPRVGPGLFFRIGRE